MTQSPTDQARWAEFIALRLAGCQLWLEDLEGSPVLTVDPKNGLIRYCRSDQELEAVLAGDDDGWWQAPVHGPRATYSRVTQLTQVLQQLGGIGAPRT